MLPREIIQGEDPFDHFKYLERHESARPPEEAYYLRLSPTDIVEFNPSKPLKTLRRIFDLGDQSKYLKFEVEQMEKLHEEIEKHNHQNSKDPGSQIHMPDYMDFAYKLRFLQATMYNHKKSIEYIFNNIKWRREFFPIQMNDHIATILSSGMLYVHGRDCRFRPIVVISPKFFIEHEKDYSSETWIQASIYFMEYLIRNMLVPGQVENWLCITDLRDISLLSLPADFHKFLKVMQCNYRARLFVNFFVGMGMFLRGLWKIVSVLLDPVTAKKIRFIAKDKTDEIFTLVNRSQVERKFGGRAKNIDSGFFPPIMPSEHYLLDSDSPEELFLSEDEYLELYHSNSLVSVSPQFKRRIEQSIKRKQEAEAKKLREAELASQKKEQERIQVFLSKNSSISNSKVTTVNQELGNSH